MASVRGERGRKGKLKNLKLADMLALLQDELGGRGALSRLTEGGELDPNQSGIDDLQDLEFFGAREARGFRDRFGGTINQIERAASGEAGDEEAARARGLAERASTVQAATFDRRTRGLDLSDRQKKSAGRRLNLTRSLAKADAGNVARRGVTDRAFEGMAALGSFEDQTFGQQAGGLTSLANAFQQRKIRRAQDSAQSSANRAGMISQGVGAILALSREDVKDKQGPAKDLLGKLKKLRIDRWNYTGESGHTHIGPYAEEFNATFDVGQENEGQISLVDVMGVTLGAIKEIAERVEAHG